MLRYRFSLSLATLAAVALLGCDNQSNSAPKPSCYSGTVVGFDCYNGFLIQVDSRFAIGAPLQISSIDSPPRPNIVVAVNQLAPLGTVGQRIYFTCANDANHQTPDWPCLAMYPPILFPVPHLVLANVSVMPCTAKESD